MCFSPHEMYLTLCVLRVESSVGSGVSEREREREREREDITHNNITCTHVFHYVPFPFVNNSTNLQKCGGLN